MTTELLAGLTGWRAQPAGRSWCIALMAAGPASRPVRFCAVERVVEGLGDGGAVRRRRPGMPIGRRRQLPALAQQVLQRPAELVVSHLKLTAAAASRVARGMSIVWAACGDPVAAGVVQLRATPGHPHRRRLPCAGPACPRGRHLHCPGAAAGGAGSASTPGQRGPRGLRAVRRVERLRRQPRCHLPPRGRHDRRAAAPRQAGRSAGGAARRNRPVAERAHRANGQSGLSCHAASVLRRAGVRDQPACAAAL